MAITRVRNKSEIFGFHHSIMIFNSLSDHHYFIINQIYRFLWVNLLPYNKIVPTAGWTDHGSLTDEPVHISKILYVRTDTTDSTLEWRVTITITEPVVTESFRFLFSVNENEVELMDLGQNSIFVLDPAIANDIYSFSAYNQRGNSKMIKVVVFHNGNAIYTANWYSDSQKQSVKTVRYSVEKLAGTSIVETKCSITNIYGGKRSYSLDF